MFRPYAPATWPRAVKFPGIAHGWHGAAWVWINLAESGRTPRNAATERAILAKLRHDLPHLSRNFHSSCLIGSGSAAVTAFRLMRLGTPVGDLPRQILTQWTASAKRGRETDLMMGSAGALLAAAEIEACAPGWIPPHFVGEMHRRCAAATRKLLMRAVLKPVYLGMSHGLAGYLLAMETAQTVFGLKFNRSLRASILDFIAINRIAAPGNMALWPMRSGESDVRCHSWCHGAPGIALALLCCHRLTRRRSYEELARLALNSTTAIPSGKPGFCCGDTGRAQILLEAYRVTGERKWLLRAAGAAKTKLSDRRRRRGFHQGSLGVEYLRQRLALPLKLPLPGLGRLSVIGPRD